MSVPSTEADVRSLQQRAEQALRAARPRDQIVRLLERLLEVADEGSEAARFAHRHLAELSLEENPWGAALHLRRVLLVNQDDDAAHALMGLCQALQGNFRMAVQAYRRATALVPGNPWYNHNLGHLLDVALDQPADALQYLRKAHRAAPDQEEVGASLVHCLGRTSQNAEAISLARSLADRHPHHKDLQNLIAWLERGADGDHLATTAGLMTGGHLPRPPAPMHRLPRPAIPSRSRLELPPAVSPPMPMSGPFATEVVHELERGGCSTLQVRRAEVVLKDYLALDVARQGTAVTVAAALAYALARIDRHPVRQRDLAVRYGVSVSALSARFNALRRALGLVDGDPRYTV